MVLIKNLKFPDPFFLGKMDREKEFGDVLDRRLVLLKRNKKQTAVINIKKYKRICGKKKEFNLTFRLFQHTSLEVINR